VEFADIGGDVFSATTTNDAAAASTAAAACATGCAGTAWRRASQGTSSLLQASGESNFQINLFACLTLDVKKREEKKLF